MPTNYGSMNTPTLISKVSPQRKAEAQRRLDTWNMSAKNVARLTAYVAQDSTPAPTPAKGKGKAQAKPQPKAADPLKAQANEAFRAAFDAAPDGDKRKAAGTAYRLVMEGTPLAKVLDAITANA